MPICLHLKWCRLGFDKCVQADDAKAAKRVKNTGGGCVNYCANNNIEKCNISFFVVPTAYCAGGFFHVIFPIGTPKRPVGTLILTLFTLREYNCAATRKFVCGFFGLFFFRRRMNFL